MTQWKFCRLKFGNEVHTFNEGEEVTVGRGVHNNIMLSSLLVSRNHCLLSVKKHKVLITDLKSSNGIFVGIQKIPQNKPYAIKDSDIIGFGLTEDAKFANVDDSEKFIFKLVKENVLSISNRIIFQGDNELDDLEKKVETLDGGQSPVLDLKPNLKRKIMNSDNVKCETTGNPEDENLISNNENIINISDSENETNVKPKEVGIKKIKLEQDISEMQKSHVNVKPEQDFLEFEAFHIKQEYLGFDEEPIPVDSESDSESEHWFMRLSQNSPGKPFTKVSLSNQDKKEDTDKEDNSYSQVEDEVSGNYSHNIIPLDEDEDFMMDLISIPPEPASYEIPLQENQSTTNQINDNDLLEDTKKTNEIDTTSTDKSLKESLSGHDTIDAVSHNSNEVHKPSVLPPINLVPRNEEGMKKIQIIVPPVRITKYDKSIESKSKSSSKKSKASSSSKRNISNSQKEERRKKLKEIANKEKKEIEPKIASNIEKEEIEQTDSTTSNTTNNAIKSTINIKMTNTNRGAFLSDGVPYTSVKSVKRKESPLKTKKHKDNKTEKPAKDLCNVDLHKTKSNCENNAVKPLKEYHKTSKSKDKHKSGKHKSKHDDILKNTCNSKETRVPPKSLKPLTESENSLSGKQFSKDEPLLAKSKKTVRFSEMAPEVRLFEIEPGNRMKKTSLVKTTLLDIQRMPVFSLEKLTLMKVLRWNPHWLEEQINNNNPPPILGHHNPPMAIFHSFNSHSQYVQLVGDLLLMEIWECLTLAYMKIRNQNTGLQMKIASLPPVPAQDRCFEISNISVDVSLPTNEVTRNLPKIGEILVVTFGDNCRRFFFVHSVRCLPSPPRNVHSFYNISLHATFTEKMKLLKPGELMIGVRLAYIHNELNLFEAMAYLANSPLSRAILAPEPHHFNSIQTQPISSPWTMILNETQQTAVTSSVAAALSDRPCIQMVQGPPGTGKSCVVSAIVMTYFYNEDGKRHQNRGKILICATSNAAVDGLIIKLLKIRQSLPKMERFRMVRVGRPEAMHERARDVSSQQLAQRDAARLAPETAPHAGEEISRLEAKINMWRTAAQDAKDPVRIAYCEGRITDILKRIDLLRSSGGGGGGGDEMRPEHLALAERRIIEGADIVVSTLSSVHNPKMKGLRRRIALCIVDEAGQAIEPESLLPLTLDVTRLTLVGDPQQLPGYICSQRAKRHGLGESLFSRLTSCAEQWPRSPVVLLQQQYRMHEHIADYPNRAFYDGRLLTPSSTRPLLPAPAYAVLGISSGDRGQGASGANEMEAWGVCRLAVALAGPTRRLGLQLAVITPYHAHKDAIKRNLRLIQDSSENGESCAGIEVNTVDSFQGQERDVVLVSLARSHGLGFVADAGRMNVLLTRAKHTLLVCLNPLAVQKNHQWRTLLEDAQRRQMFKTLPNEMCQAAGSMTNEDILDYISNVNPTTRTKR